MERPDGTILGQSLIDTVAEWLVDESLGQNSIEHTFEGVCQRLHSVGLPLTRATLTFATLHPQTSTVSLAWKDTEGVNRSDYGHQMSGQSEQFRASPFYHLLSKNIDLIRRRLTGPEANLDFPICADLAEQGYTDYLIAQVAFDSPVHAAWEYETGILVSWATMREGGFSNNDITALLRIQRRLGVASKVSIQDQITHNVMETYLGKDASKMVLDGQIKRGDGEQTNAVIFYSDMRNSTRLIETMPPDVYLETLNAYFESTAGAVRDGGGDILTFIGDAVLAIFPFGGEHTTNGTECGVRTAALQSALEAIRRGDEINRTRQAEGKVVFDFGISLHVGDVLFGNIGIPERLSFSVIGPAINEAARLESLTKTLKRPILATSDFIETLESHFIDVGSHVLRGVHEPVEVFTPKALDRLPQQAAE